MEKRTKKILDIIIKEYCRSAVPVASSFLVDKYKLGVSSATVRNDMVLLEDEGYIYQPHTSAGRVPTEKAYLEHTSQLKPKKIKDDIVAMLNKYLFFQDESLLKTAAKELSAISGHAIFWAFDKRNLYYTGLSNLFSQPEFRHSDLIYDLSRVIDRLDEQIEKIFDDMDNGKNIYIGSANPFSANCSALILKYTQNNKIGMMGIIGPMRMDYEFCAGLLELIENKLK